MSNQEHEANDLEIMPTANKELKPEQTKIKQVHAVVYNSNSIFSETTFTYIKAQCAIT